jgi:hypothetical protein
MVVAQVLLRYDDERHWLRRSETGRAPVSRLLDATPVPCGQPVKMFSSG